MKTESPQVLLSQARGSIAAGMRYYYGGFDGYVRNSVSDRAAYMSFCDSITTSHSALEMLQRHEPFDTELVEYARQLYCNAVLMAYKSLLRDESRDIYFPITLRRLKKMLRVQSGKMFTEQHGDMQTWKRLAWISAPFSHSAKLERSRIDDKEELVKLSRQ